MRRLFAIEGLACGGCARGLERHLSRLPAVRSVGVHHLTASALVDWDETRLSVEGIGRAVAVAGYRLIERHHAEELASRLDADIRRLSLRLGTQGRHRIDCFEDAGRAADAMVTLYRAKQKRGYQLVG